MTYDPIDEDADGAYDTNELTVNTLNGLDLNANVGQGLQVDGDTVFTPTFSYFDDFDTNTIAEYDIFDSTTIDNTDFSISNSELQQADTNAHYFVGYDVSNEGLNSFFIESLVNSNDDDLIGLGFVIDGSTSLIGQNQQQKDTANIRENSFPAVEYRTDVGDFVQTTVTVPNPPFTQRLEYDSLANQAELFLNGTSILTKSFSHSGTVTLCGLVSDFNNPGPHWDSFEIGSL